MYRNSNHARCSQSPQPFSYISDAHRRLKLFTFLAVSSCAALALPSPPPSPRLTAHSSFQCIGTGSQSFDWNVFLLTERPICVLNDVCMIDDELVYYEDPAVEGAARSIYHFAEATVKVTHGLFHERVPVRIVRGPLPGDAAFAPVNRVHALDIMSDASNYGHLLIDTVIPAFAAAEIFGFAPETLQLVQLLSCDTYLNRTRMEHKAGPNFFKKYVERCREQLQRWIPLLFSHPMLMPPHKKQCFHTLLYGHSGMMHGQSFFPHRSSAVRAMRLALYENLRIPLPELHPPAGHKVFVWRKLVEYTASEFNPCALVDAWGLKLQTTCITPALMDTRSQATEMADATLVVAEEGSTTYGAFFFLRPGASLIVIGQKEAHMLFELSHINVFFISVARAKSAGEGAALVDLALDRAGRRFEVL